jgi:hypothetical protein
VPRGVLADLVSGARPASAQSSLIDIRAQRATIDVVVTRRSTHQALDAPRDADVATPLATLGVNNGSGGERVME